MSTRSDIDQNIDKVLVLAYILVEMSVTMNLIWNDDDEEIVQKSWFAKTTLENKAFSHYKGWFHVLMVFINTFLTLRAI